MAHPLHVGRVGAHVNAHTGMLFFHLLHKSLHALAATAHHTRPCGHTAVRPKHLRKAGGHTGSKSLLLPYSHGRQLSAIAPGVVTDFLQAAAHAASPSCQQFLVLKLLPQPFIALVTRHPA